MNRTHLDLEKQNEIVFVGISFIGDSYAFRMQ